MNENKFNYVKITSTSGEKHEYTIIKDFQVNIKFGLLTLQLEDGEFGFLIDNLKYFEVGLPPQNGETAFHQCDVMLKPSGDEPAEVVSISDVINYDWKIDNGLLMVFGKTVTKGFHLDQVISYQLNNIQK